MSFVDILTPTTFVMLTPVSSPYTSLDHICKNISIMNNYWLIGGGAVLGILIVASIVAAVLQKEAEFAPGSPEAAVQAYLRALDEEDFQAAYDLLSPELQSRCSTGDMFGRRVSNRWQLEEKRITLESAQTIEETTFVTVRVAELRGGGLFGPSEYAFEVSFALRQFDGHWKFSQNPWPSFDCARDAPEPPRPVAP